MSPSSMAFYGTLPPVGTWNSRWSNAQLEVVVLCPCKWSKKVASPEFMMCRWPTNIYNIMEICCCCCCFFFDVLTAKTFFSQNRMVNPTCLFLNPAANGGCHSPPPPHHHHRHESLSSPSWSSSSSSWSPSELHIWDRSRRQLLTLNM